MVEGEDREKLNDLLGKVNKILFHEINTSNFYSAVQPAMEDFCIQQACVSVNPTADGKGLEFRHFSPFQYAFRKSSDGMPDHVYLKEWRTGRQLLEEHRDELGQEMIELLEEKPLKEYCTTITVTPIEDTDKYLHMIVLDKASSRDSTVLFRQEVPRQAFKIARWGEDQLGLDGFGPGMVAYPDVRFLNNLKENALMHMELQNAGVYTGTDDGIFNPHNVTIEPGAIIPVLSNDNQNPTLRPLPISSNLELAQFEIRELRAEVLKTFYADRFSQVGDSKLSPTEVMMKAKIIAQELGPAYAQLQREFMLPMIYDIVDILKQQGKIPKQVEVGTGIIDVVFISQLAQSQRLQEVESMMQFSAMIDQQAQLDPAITSIVDRPKMMYTIAEAMQIPREVIRDQDAAKQVTEQGMKNVATIQGMTEQAAGGPPDDAAQAAPIQ
jgi:hypothetical protein